VSERNLQAAAKFGCLAIAILLTIGCGATGPEMMPVSGKVTQNGNPVAEAKILLHPQQQLPTGIPLPMAISDERGDFKVTSLSNGDGALPGMYRVTVELRAPSKSGEETIRDGRHLLPLRYSDPATSDLVREVKPGENRWEPFDLPPR
jgi:hypothetical protein